MATQIKWIVHVECVRKPPNWSVKRTETLQNAIVVAITFKDCQAGFAVIKTNFRKGRF
jgi:hypothetical protein